MTPHKQRFRHDPANGVYGDCWRTAIACLLDIEPEEIPHEHRPYADNEQQTIIADFLRPRGLTIVAFAWEEATVEQIIDWVGGSNPAPYWLLSGTSRTGCNHVVICKGREIVHDTSLTDAGIIGPNDAGQVVAEFLGKL